jgi:hypothetical protein
LPQIWPRLEFHEQADRRDSQFVVVERGEVGRDLGPRTNRQRHL